MKINKNCWHYKVTMLFSDRWGKPPKDFCAYWRKFCFSCLGVLFFSLMASILILILGNAVYQYPLGALIGFGITITFITVLVSVAYTYEKAIMRPNTSKPKNPGIIRMKFDSIKNKYCPIVEYEE